MRGLSTASLVRVLEICTESVLSCFIFVHMAESSGVIFISVPGEYWIGDR